jgi:hypothetical protein
MHRNHSVVKILQIFESTYFIFRMLKLSFMFSDVQPIISTLTTFSEAWLVKRIIKKNYKQLVYHYWVDSNYILEITKITSSKIVPSKLALKTHTNFGCAASLATLDKLVDRFPLPSVSLPIGDTSLTYVMRLAAHSTTSPTPTPMGQSFINNPVLVLIFS